VSLDEISFSGQAYEIEPEVVPVRIDIAKMMGEGWSLRLRFAAALTGPCMRCLIDARPLFEIDAREIDQPGGGEDLDSPYVNAAQELDVSQWAHDAFALALPAQILCREDCAGLCPVCGANLNEDRGHEHEPEPDPRWAALRDLKLD
jgi:uncharacterized protein